jgi:hypothetical protein
LGGDLGVGKQKMLGEKMIYKYKTNFKTLKAVYQIVKKMGLLNLFTGNVADISAQSETQTIDIITQLFEHNTVNEFCQTVTGSDEDFEEKDIEELEGVILGFFECTKESWNRLKLAQVFNQENLPL